MLTLVAAGVWGYMLQAAPYELGTVLWPEKWVWEDFMGHARFVLQLDYICTFGASFLWLGYEYVGLYWVGGIRGWDWVGVVSMMPVVTAVGGPAAGVAFAWWWKERLINRGAGNQ